MELHLHLNWNSARPLAPAGAGKMVMGEMAKGFAAVLLLTPLRPQQARSPCPTFGKDLHIGVNVH